MSRVTAFAVYATGLALLEHDDDAVVDRLAALAADDANCLSDARDLLWTISAGPDQTQRARQLIERAITRVDPAPTTGDRA